jgi:hypothetical protein
MPAIHPARLKQQAAALTDQFDEPAMFIRSLHHLLESYAERVAKPGQSGEPPTLSQAYQVRPPVIRKILIELTPLVQDDPVGGLALCDTLWEQSYLEFRLLAIALLGKIPCQAPEPILERINSWSKPDLEHRLQDALLDQGMESLRKDQPDAVISQLETWLDPSNDTFHHLIGLRALEFLADHRDFENLPVIFHLIEPMTRTTHPSFRPEILDILAVLAHRSPRETALFLKQTLEIPNSPDTAWLIRQSMQEFPADLQEDLRQAWRGEENRSNN